MSKAFRDDKPTEECGVFGIFAPEQDVARITFFGLYALQHRGQESAGIATSDGEHVSIRTRIGLVSQAFSEDDLALLPGHIAVGHARYSTQGANSPRNAGPMMSGSNLGPVVVAHNGNITNALALREELEHDGERFLTTTDSEILTRLIALSPGFTFVDKIRHAMTRMLGAYSLAILSKDRLFAVRDPLGVRPLCLGKIDDNWVVASESCALATVGATFVREVEPGEIVEIKGASATSYTQEFPRKQAMCLFELIYFARPDSIDPRPAVAHGSPAHGRAAGARVPGRRGCRRRPARLGDTGRDRLCAGNRDPVRGGADQEPIHRPDVYPARSTTAGSGVSLKFNALPEAIAGKRVVLVDDTIVRGTTSRPIVQLLRNSGAKEVHMRVHAPPMMWPCYLGVDLARRDELIAARMTVPDIGRFIGADSIGYLSLEGLLEAIDAPDAGFCTGCLTGHYPVNVQMGLDKLVLERV